MKKDKVRYKAVVLLEVLLLLLFEGEKKMRWSKGFSKIGLLALILVVVGAGMFFYTRQYCGAEQPARYEPQQLRQVITADSKTSRTIMWQTQAPESDTWVEYKLQGERASQGAGPRERICDRFRDCLSAKCDAYSFGAGNCL